MKFSSSLEFNAVREWLDFYIHYDRLKRLIYDMERLSADQYRQSTPNVSDDLDESEQSLVRHSDVDHDHNEFLRRTESESDLERGSQGGKGRKDRRGSSGTVHTMSETRPFLSSSSTAVAAFLPTSSSLMADKRKAFFEMIQSERAKVNAFYRKKEAEMVAEVVVLSAAIQPYERSGCLNYSIDGSETDGLDVPILSPAMDYVKRGELTTRLRDLYINLCSLKNYVVLNYTGMLTLVF
jgi:SPX domain protein involved in polyphosphate accumulation